MMIDLKGEVALVIGAPSAVGLGYAAARLMRKRDAHLFLTDNDTSSVDARAAELRTDRVREPAMRHDVTNEKVWVDVIAAVLMGRMGEPADVGALVAVPAPDDAKYITGAEFVVDRGMVAQ